LYVVEDSVDVIIQCAQELHY